MRFSEIPRSVYWIAIAALTLAHFVWIAGYVESGYASPDADGYFAQAQMILEHGRPGFEAESPVQYIGIHWLEKADGEFISRYPPGLPLLIAAAWATLGRDAIFYLNPLLASLTVLCVFLLCRRRLGEPLALAAAGVMAVAATANYHAVHADAHTASGFFLISGIVLLSYWSDTGKRWAAFAGGFLLAVTPTVRYAEGMAAIGAAAFLWLHWRREDRRPGALLAAAGAAIPGGLLMLHNQLQFGALWRTGYTLTNESTLKLEYFLQNWPSYLDALSTSGVGLFFVLGIVGMAAMVRDPEQRPLGLLLGLSAAAITLVYCSYYFNRGEGGATRFLLPTLPLYLLPALLFLRSSLNGRLFAGVVGVFLLISAARGIPESRARMRGQQQAAARSEALIAWLEEQVPPGSILVPGRIGEQIHFTGNWKLADEGVLNSDRRGFGGPGRGFPGMDEDAPSPMQRDKAKELRAKYEGLSPDERSAEAMKDLLAWANGKPVYWIRSEGLGAPEVEAQTSAVEVSRLEAPGDEPDERENRGGDSGFAPPGGRRGRGGFPGPRAGGPGGRGRRGGPGMRPGPGGFMPPPGFGGPGFGGPGMGGPGMGPPGGPGGMFGVGSEPLTLYRIDRQ